MFEVLKREEPKSNILKRENLNYKLIKNKMSTLHLMKVKARYRISLSIQI